MALEQGALGIKVCRVGSHKGAERRGWVDAWLDIGQHDVLWTQLRLQPKHQFDAQLPRGSDDQMLPHAQTKVG